MSRSDDGEGVWHGHNPSPIGTYGSRVKFLLAMARPQIEYTCSECGELRSGLVSHDVCPDCRESRIEKYSLTSRVVSAEDLEPDDIIAKNPSLWRRRRRQAKERDNWACCDCGMTQEEHRDRDDVFPPNAGLHVHHIIEKSEFADPDKAHALDNLVTLCCFCHDDRHDHSIRVL